MFLFCKGKSQIFKSLFILQLSICVFFIIIERPYGKNVMITSSSLPMNKRKNITKISSKYKTLHNMRHIPFKTVFLIESFVSGSSVFNTVLTSNTRFRMSTDISENKIEYLAISFYRNHMIFSNIRKLFLLSVDCIICVFV